MVCVCQGRPVGGAAASKVDNIHPSCCQSLCAPPTVRTSPFTSSSGVFVFDCITWRAGSPVDCGWSSFSWDVADCRLSTWTPRMCCGRPEIQAACSASLSPCTGSSIRWIRECKSRTFCFKGERVWRQPWPRKQAIHVVKITPVTM